MKKTAKFGGSSVANSTQIKKVCDIVLNDKEICAVVVSAPGKRYSNDIKVTDLLIDLYEKYRNKDPKYKEQLENIIKRYEEIVLDLKLDEKLLDDFRLILNKYLDEIDDSFYLENAIKSCGEDFNARLIAKYISSLGYKCSYLSPKEAGILVEHTINEPIILEETYNNIKRFKDDDRLFIIPGFYAISPQGKIITFQRGGSDITGSIVARGLECDIYENFTDMSYIYTAHPNLIDNPKPITNITYREMRELSYNGFEIFQEDAVAPLLKNNIKIQVKNTNDPNNGGTIIETKRNNIKENPIIGISNVGDFLAFNITEYLMNKQVGYINKLLDIFEYQHIPVEHIPTGIDSLSILIRKKYITSEFQMQNIINTIKTNFDFDEFEIIDDLSAIAIVGEGLKNIMTQTLYKISKTFDEENIKLEAIIQGASNNSLFVFIKKENEKLAIQKLYKEFFN
ncbi:aspartate kinase [Anaerococcus porci]|uniref:Aspartokinase n=1 Tax=Anaerococcus porci TaxID=2652269 RepID=A0A6N7VT18_9FIRM|nr:aspartate kinase [Anaerococcus porci]MDY3006242.1 aspartate kinase [Anaerococcus porci]MSS77214.1 aspartate kinase [Anaerococcus porci]